MAKTNINTADANDLEKVGFNSSQALNLVDYRESNGLFETIEDIVKVKGIGQATFEKVKNKISISWFFLSRFSRLSSDWHLLFSHRFSSFFSSLFFCICIFIAKRRNIAFFFSFRFLDFCFLFFFQAEKESQEPSQESSSRAKRITSCSSVVKVLFMFIRRITIFLSYLLSKWKGNHPLSRSLIMSQALIFHLA